LDFYLAGAERWLAENVVGVDLLVTIAAMEDGTELKNMCAHIVALHAFYAAVPSLDLVLTSNGFGIVNNNNIVPASAERVKSLREGMIAERDELLRQLLLLLAKRSDWLATSHAEYFRATLFPFMEPGELMGETTNLWQLCQSWRGALIGIETELADKYISAPIYAKLREHKQAGTLTVAENAIVLVLQSIEVELLRGKTLNYPRIISLVDTIRKNPTDFPEWATSDTAKLYQLHSFNNTKTSHGYWF